MNVRYIKQKMKYNFTVELYNLLYLMRKKQMLSPNVQSIDVTIDKIVKDKCSVSRFGDGEILLINNEAIRFQKSDQVLGMRLSEVLRSDSSEHIVCISDVFNGLSKYSRSAIRFWRTHFYLYGHVWNSNLKSDRIYYNTFITRPYIDFQVKDQCGAWFASLKRIWNNRNIIFIEGEKSRLGVNNTLFSNSLSVKRILCPATNAFDKYEEILQKAMEQDTDVLYLIALGPTATVLAYDLSKTGRQAIDVGHVDIEYEWYRIGAKRKVAVSSKYVNEALEGEINDVADTTYKEQIIAIIKA